MGRNPNFFLLNSISHGLWNIDDNSEYLNVLRLFNILLECGLSSFDNNSIKHYFSQGYLHGVWDELMKYFIITEIDRDGLYVSEKIFSGKRRDIFVIKWFDK